MFSFTKLSFAKIPCLQDQEGKLPTKLIAPPQEVGGGIEHQKAAIRRKTEIKLENLSDLVQYQEPSKALSFAPRHPGSGGQLCGSAKRKLIRKTSMGDLQQERVELVMKREELAKEWLDSDRERQRFQVKVLHANLNMRTIETQLEQMTRREIELRTEVQRRWVVLVNNLLVNTTRDRFSSTSCSE